MFLERGFVFTHETVRDGEARFAPLVAAQLRTERRGTAGTKWHADETYITVNGRWCSRYRAIDREGDLVDARLRPTRDRDAARRCFAQALDRAGAAPAQVTTDGHDASPRASREARGDAVSHRTNRFKNNRIEQDHRGVKQHSYPMRGFGSFTAAARCCSGFAEQRQYFRSRTRQDERVSLAEQRRLFRERWAALLTELAIACLSPAPVSGCPRPPSTSYDVPNLTQPEPMAGHERNGCRGSRGHPCQMLRPSTCALLRDARHEHGPQQTCCAVGEGSNACSRPSGGDPTTRAAGAVRGPSSPPRPDSSDPLSPSCPRSARPRHSNGSGARRWCSSRRSGKGRSAWCWPRRWPAAPPSSHRIAARHRRYSPRGSPDSCAAARQNWPPRSRTSGCSRRSRVASASQYTSPPIVSPPPMSTPIAALSRATG